MVNRQGALILASENHPIDAVLEIRNVNTGQSAQGRVVWHGGEQQAGVYKIGIELIGELPQFWGVDCLHSVRAKPTAEP